MYRSEETTSQPIFIYLFMFFWLLPHFDQQHPFSQESKNTNYNQTPVNKTWYPSLKSN